MAKTRASATNGTKVAAWEKPLAAYVTSLTVENIRCFGSKQRRELTDHSALYPTTGRRPIACLTSPSVPHRRPG